MGILEWILAQRPGTVQDCGDRLEVKHESGEYSTLWKQVGHKYPGLLGTVSDCYSAYDGIDLFSSTFKLASVIEPQRVDNVKLTFTLAELDDEVKAKCCSFPVGAVPFMYQAGIGYYAVAPASGSIYEWDIEDRQLSDKFDTIESILSEWISAIG
jgi:hypothetical protein